MSKLITVIDAACSLFVLWQGFSGLDGRKGLTGPQGVKVCFDIHSVSLNYVCNIIYRELKVYLDLRA